MPLATRRNNCRPQWPVAATIGALLNVSSFRCSRQRRPRTRQSSTAPARIFMTAVFCARHHAQGLARQLYHQCQNRIPCWLSCCTAEKSLGWMQFFSGPSPCQRRLTCTRCYYGPLDLLNPVRGAALKESSRIFNSIVQSPKIIDPN